MNDRTIVQHPNGYSGVLMGKSTMMIYDKDDNCIVHTCFRTPNTEKELYEVLETMPRFIEILASVEADRKTEPTSSKMEQVDKDINVRSKTMRDCYNCKRYEAEGECIECHYEPKDEPHAEIPEYAEWKEPFEKMTDCPWK